MTNLWFEKRSIRALLFVGLLYQWPLRREPTCQRPLRVFKCCHARDTHSHAKHTGCITVEFFRQTLNFIVFSWRAKTFIKISAMDTPALAQSSNALHNQYDGRDQCPPIESLRDPYEKLLHGRLCHSEKRVNLFVVHCYCKEKGSPTLVEFLSHRQVIE